MLKGFGLSLGTYGIEGPGAVLGFRRMILALTASLGIDAWQVTRAAEECAMLLARFIAPDRTIQVLLPMIDSEEYPINLAAIKMMTQLIENSSDDAIVDFLPEMSPTLLKVLIRTTNIT